MAIAAWTMWLAHHAAISTRPDPLFRELVGWRHSKGSYLYGPIPFQLVAVMALGGSLVWRLRGKPIANGQRWTFYFLVLWCLVMLAAVAGHATKAIGLGALRVP